eukprot:TRINITY_DN260_c0_g3_i3.p1 TRINITY_DN260_c0_g3~~TRINITY_DN260_c0_g3_i3.p1  ORF type:complete len:1209 (-),score=478.65 TRINITY_DN260_c0_g3_i3:113-3739(-)
MAMHARGLYRSPTVDLFHAENRYEITRPLGRERSVAIFEGVDRLRLDSRGEFKQVVIRVREDAGQADVVHPLDIKHPHLIRYRAVLEWRRQQQWTVCSPFPSAFQLSHKMSAGPLQEHEIHWIARGILSGLHQLHKRGIGHHRLNADHVWVQGGHHMGVKLANYGPSNAAALSKASSSMNASTDSDADPTAASGSPPPNGRSVHESPPNRNGLARILNVRRAAGLVMPTPLHPLAPDRDAQQPKADAALRDDIRAFAELFATMCAAHDVHADAPFALRYATDFKDFIAVCKAIRSGHDRQSTTTTLLEHPFMTRTSFKPFIGDEMALSAAQTLFSGGSSTGDPHKLPPLFLPPVRPQPHSSFGRQPPTLAITPINRPLSHLNADLINSIETDSSDQSLALLRGGADPNYISEQGVSPMHLAALHDADLTMNFLLRAGGMVNLVDMHGRMPLHCACLNGGHRLVKRLLETDGVLVGQSWSGPELSPLHIAAMLGKVQVVELLIKARADLDARDADGRTPLHWAATGDHAKVVRLLLDAGADVNAKDHYLATPLLMTLKRSTLADYERSCVPLLVQKGAELDVTDTFGHSTLFWAFSRNFAELIEAMLGPATAPPKLPPPPVSREDDGSYLQLACRAGMATAAEMLLEKGADTNETNKLGQTPLQALARQGVHRWPDAYTQVARALLKAGADPGAVDPTDHNTLLHTAARDGLLELVEVLVDTEGVQVDAPNDWGLTPLGVAVQQHTRLMVGSDSDGLQPDGLYQRDRVLRCIELLADKGADLSRPMMGHGHTMLHWAVAHADKKVGLLLVSRGAHPFVRDELGLTPVHIAAKMSQEKTSYLFSARIVQMGVQRWWRHSRADMWKNFLLYLAFLIVLTAVAILDTTRDDRHAFQISESFRDLLLRKQTGPVGGRESIIYTENIFMIEDYWKWAEYVLLDAMYPVEYPNHHEIERENFGYVTNNIILGDMRLRQMRVRELEPHECPVGSRMQSIIQRCPQKYTLESKATGHFGDEHDANFSSAAAFHYHESEDQPIYGRFGTYDSGGFMAYLGHNGTENRIIVEELKHGNWLDYNTRAVFVDFTVFNAVMNMFTAVQLHLEVTSSGNFYTNAFVLTSTLHKYWNASSYVILAFECCLLAYVVHMALEKYRKFVSSFAAHHDPLSPWRGRFAAIGHVLLVRLHTRFESLLAAPSSCLRCRLLTLFFLSPRAT